MKKRFGMLFWSGLAGTLILGISFFINIYQAFWGNKTIWWTNRDTPVAIERTVNIFEIYIYEKPLKRHISEKTLFTVDKSGKNFIVASKDISVRLNNWEGVKSSFLAYAVLSGFGLGIAFTILSIGFLQYFSKTKNILSNSI